jgi:hypothetical protein
LKKIDLDTKLQGRLSGKLLQGSKGSSVPFSDGRGVKYPARKLTTVVTGNKWPIVLKNSFFRGAKII